LTNFAVGRFRQIVHPPIERERLIARCVYAAEIWADQC